VTDGGLTEWIKIKQTISDVRCLFVNTGDYYEQVNGQDKKHGSKGMFM
jgi:hypothetical protein